MAEGQESGPIPEPAPRKSLKTSGEMARSLGFEYDKPNSTPIDIRYTKPLTIQEGSGLEGLLVDTGTFWPEQGFSLEASLGPPTWSKTVDLLVGTVLKPEDLDRLGLGPHISNHRLPFSMLRAGGYSKVAAAISEVEQSGILSRHLAELLAQNSFGHQLLPEIIAAFQKQLPQFPRLIDRYDVNRTLYLVGEPPRGKKSLPILEIGVGANGIRILPTTALPGKDSDHIIDFDRIKRYDSRIGHINASWITPAADKYMVGDLEKAREDLNHAVTATLNSLAEGKI